MPAENNTNITTDFAVVQSIDFTERFTGSLTKLIEALGITRKIPMSSGMLIKTYNSTVTMANGTVAEGELIPLSKVERKLGPTYELGFQKYRKAVTAEAIQQSGFDLAVAHTDEKLLREVQTGVRHDFFDFLATGTGQVATPVADVKAAFAQAWGAVQTVFEDDGVNTIVFCNPLDVADYLADANVTVQTAFGLTYITGFTNVTVITNTYVPKGTVYATAPENIVLAYVQLTGGELGRAFSFTLDTLNLIGVTHREEINNLTYQTVVLSGIKLFAENLAGVIKINITPAPATKAAKA